MVKNGIAINRKPPVRLLTEAGGFLEGYGYTLNPYAGCAFGCSYCYVRRMPIALFRQAEWGSWVDVKIGSADLLRKELQKAKRKGPVTIFMSSGTDPYQPLEYKEKITRSLLEVMVEIPPDFLFVQTRSPLVVRDIDLLVRLGDRIRVSITIETDLDQVRKTFSPAAPPIAARLRALARLSEAGLPTQAAVAPVLPSSDRFAALLAGVTNRICLDDYFMGDGSHGGRTKQLGIGRIYRELGLDEWYSPDAYKRVRERLSAHFPDDRILISKAGFMPPAPTADE